MRSLETVAGANSNFSQGVGTQKSPHVEKLPAGAMLEHISADKFAGGGSEHTDNELHMRSELGLALTASYCRA